VKRILVGLAALVVLLAGLGGAYVLYRKHQQRNVHGSSTIEFVTTEPVPAPRPPAELSQVPWPMYGYDELRTRAVEGLGVAPPFRHVWTFRAQSLLEFPPAVAYRRLYFASNAGVMFAISARTGKRAWKVATNRCVAASPAVADALVFMTYLNMPPCNASTVKDGELVAYSPGTGRVVWKQRIGPSETSPLVAQGLVVVGDWRGDVTAFHEKSGKLAWRFHTGGRVKGAAAADGRRLYVGSYDGHLYALDLRSGKLRWRVSAQGSFLGNATFYATPAVGYGRVYIGATDGKMYSFGAQSGKLRWSHGTGGYVYASAALWRGLALVGSYGGSFFAFDAATGDVRWKFKANGPISGSPSVVDGIVYFATLKRRTYALDARTGRVVWTFPDGKYTPVVADSHRLYVVGYARVYGLLPRNGVPLKAVDILAALRKAHALKGAHFRVLRSAAGAERAARKLHGVHVCNVAVQSRRRAKVVALLRDACAG
jgi:outer membrane protein assembly factor BamB